MKELILAVYPEWENYLPDDLTDKVLEELASGMKDGFLKYTVEAIGKIDILELYDNINLLNDVLNLMYMERDNDFFAELKNSKVDSAANILNKIINPGQMIKSGLELGNANLVSMGGMLGLELFIAQEVASSIEELGKFVTGMILMSWDTDSIDDVYRGNITLEEYLDGE